MPYVLYFRVLSRLFVSPTQWVAVLEYVIIAILMPRQVRRLSFIHFRYLRFVCLFIDRSAAIPEAKIVYTIFKCEEKKNNKKNNEFVILYFLDIMTYN